MANPNAAAGRGEVLRLAAIGTAACAFSGLFGVGGGVIFVPALTVFIGLSQVEAEAPRC